MQRRLAMISAGAAAAAAATTVGAWAQGKPKPAAGHEHHHGQGKYAAVMTSAMHCVTAGEVCLDHCHVALGEGDKSLAECARSVSELLAVCTALRSLAAQNSPRLPQLAKVALDSCLACEKECRKHENKHQQCKDCAEACKECAAECRKVMA